MTYDEFVALGAPELPIGYTYRFTYAGNGYGRLEIVEEHTTLFLHRTKYVPVASRYYNIGVFTRVNSAVILYEEWQREIRARENTDLGVLER